MTVRIRHPRSALAAIAITVGLASGIVTTPASATLIFDLTTGNAAISGFPGPYAQVAVTLNTPTTATVAFTSLTNGGNIYLMGDGSTAAVNVDASSFTITGITGSNGGTGFSPGPFSVANPPARVMWTASAASTG